MFRLLSKIPKLVNLWRGVILRRLILISGGKCGARLTVEKGLRIRQGFHSRWELGTDVYVGRNTTIDCLPGTLLRIGNNVSITEGLFVSVCERVEVGAGSVVGANSFAIRQLSTEGIYARSPARLIQNRRRI